MNSQPLGSGTPLMPEQWDSRNVREKFLEFFENKDHKRLPSFPLIPANDPTLLWVTAGMSPFKAEFAGIAKPVYPRITTCQKCLRADDIEKVGRTTRHHTFFEMLGNFSFGDYFKKEAIEWAWELLTHVYCLPQDKLFVSIYPKDEEAYRIWRDKIKLPEERIYRLEDNWWGPIGKTGTCGPDTEIYFDRGEKLSCGKPECKPGCENIKPSGEPCDRYIEIWNLVFTMYHKDEKENLHELPQKNIDTGAGLERLTMVLQNKDSPYETDLFKLIMEGLLGIDYPDNLTSQPKKNYSARIVADHLRAVCFAIGDGVYPSNEGRGYVLQRILRRASLHFRTLFPGKTSLADYVDHIIGTYASFYPELDEKREIIIKTVRQGYEEYKKLLDTVGLDLFHEIWNSVQSQDGVVKLQNGIRIVPGEILFKYHDEKGLPFEVAKELLENDGFKVDEAGFQKEMEKQRERSRASRQGIVDLLDTAFENQGSNSLSSSATILGPTEFLGYEKTESEGKILLLQKLLENKKQEQTEILNQEEKGILVLDKTSFYAESGGQVGDTGILRWETGEAEVLDTQKNEGGIFFHTVFIKKGGLKQGETVKAQVNRDRRKQIRKHHTATHLLHAALREILGPHVQQAGSYVCDTYLRLDFSHPHALTFEEIQKIEHLVNQKIQSNFQIETRITTPEKAKELGALAFFGEKYGEKVRAVLVNEFSRELCGGTHAESTGELGLFVLLKESSIAKGMRRIEARAGESAYQYYKELRTFAKKASESLKADDAAPENLGMQLDILFQEKKEDEKKIRMLQQERAAQQALSLKEKAESIAGITWISVKVETDGKEALRAMVDTLKKQIKSGIILLASVEKEKISLICGITPDLIQKGFSALELIKPVSKMLGGGGGGKADLAEAGGKEIKKIETAFQEAKKMVQEKLSVVQQKGV
jgi:alanyl-tRNA synthetase